MKKRIAFRKLNRTPAHKRSMLRNMVSSLIQHERIITTVAKAKEVRHLADQMVTLAKKGGPLLDGSSSSAQASPTYLHNRRRAAAVVRGDDIVTKLFEVLGPRYAVREGGYTRILKLAQPRHGDHAPMAVIEYVDRPGEIRAARPPRATILAGENQMPQEVLDAVRSQLENMGISPVEDLVTLAVQDELQTELEMAASKAEEEGDNSEYGDKKAASTFAADVDNNNEKLDQDEEGRVESPEAVKEDRKQ